MNILGEIRAIKSLVSKYFRKPGIIPSPLLAPLAPIVSLISPTDPLATVALTLSSNAATY